MAEEVITIDNRGAVEVVSLNRPDKLNTMNEALIQALLDYFAGLVNRPAVRVVILRAEGRAFCAGLDLGGWTAVPDAGPVFVAERPPCPAADEIESVNIDAALTICGHCAKGRVLRG